MKLLWRCFIISHSIKLNMLFIRVILHLDIYLWSLLSQEFISYLYSKHSSRPSFTMNEQLQELTVFVCTFSHNHHLFWTQLPFKYSMRTWENATEWTIFSAMKHAGFHRWIAWIKSSISEKNRLLQVTTSLCSWTSQLDSRTVIQHIMNRWNMDSRENT